MIGRRLGEWLGVLGVIGVLAQPFLTANVNRARPSAVRTVLHAAAKSGELPNRWPLYQDWETRLGAGAPTADGKTLLMSAAQAGRLSSVRFLLDRGADPNRQDRWGQTAVYYARRAGHPEIIGELRRGGARW
jgi:hypothetical protein